MSPPAKRLQGLNIPVKPLKVTLCKLDELIFFFSSAIFGHKFFRATVPNSYDPDQTQCFVGPDLGLNLC